MSAPRTPLIACALLIAAASTLAACGGGPGYTEVYYEEIIVVEPLGDAEVDNQTDLTGTFENLYFFEMAPALTDFWTGQLLPDVIFPGEIVYVGSFEEDFYDAAAELDLGWVEFFDIYVEGGWTTTFEVF